MNSLNGMGVNSILGRGSTGSSMRNNSAGGFGGGSRGGGKGDIIPKGHRAGVLQQFTPEQLDLFSQLFGHLGPDSDLSRLAGGDESIFEQMEAPAWRQFQEAQGQLGSRFSQLAPGAMSAQRGSGFQNTAGQLGSDFAMNLSANRQKLSRQALQDLFEMSHMLMNEKPFERIISGKEQKEPGFWQQFGSNFAQSAGKKAGNFLFGG